VSKMEYHEHPEYEQLVQSLENIREQCSEIQQSVMDYNPNEIKQEMDNIIKLVSSVI